MLTVVFSLCKRRNKIHRLIVLFLLNKEAWFHYFVFPGAVFTTGNFKKLNEHGNKIKFSQ